MKCPGNKSSDAYWNKMSWEQKSINQLKRIGETSVIVQPEWDLFG